jgi:hypothetical protein
MKRSQRRVASARAVAGEFYGTPKELWGFREPGGPGTPRQIADRFLVRNASRLGLQPELETLKHVKVVPSLGAHHVIYQQNLGPRRVHRAYVTVHIDRNRDVYLVKNRAMPTAMLPREERFDLKRATAAQRARGSLHRKRRRAVLQDQEKIWFPEKDKLVPAWKIRLGRQHPREEWIVYVDARTGRVLSKVDNLSKAVRGRARVFDPNPVTALDGHEDLLTDKLRERKPPDKAYVERALYGLTGNGRLTGSRVTTLRTPAKHQVKRTSHRYLLGSREKGFEQLMAYYHIDRAVRYLGRLGFKGARRVFDAPVAVNARATREDQSWYSPAERLIGLGTGWIDDAEDGETIIHELGHAIQDAIVPDFGQSREAAAMGEGFGDYLAASLFAERKPERYRTSVMSWDGIRDGLTASPSVDPPALRYVDWDWTFDDFQDAEELEHSNGEIWSATLWDVRDALGRETADRIIVESHFQLDGFTSFARGARAILDADEHINGGNNRTRLRAIMEDRRIKPV